jgi:hypothetical protein
VLQLVDDANEDDVVLFSKIDLSDGLWRMIVEEGQQWSFAYVMPDPPGSPIRIIIPSQLQMGWAESPAYFCAATKTGRDHIQRLIQEDEPLPPHAFEHYIRPHKAPKRSRSDHPAHGVYVYVDDYILAAIEDASGTLLGRVGRAALHGIHDVFPPPHVSGHAGGKDTISLKKLEKGDVRWDPRKEIMGFLIDGRARTIQLPTDKAADITTEIRRILTKKRVTLKRYRRIVGKLRHVTLIMPGTRGVFSPINKALKGNPAVIGLGTKSEVRHALLDLGTLVADLTSRPTKIKDLVPGLDAYRGYCDACAAGAGGVWFSGEDKLEPMVWRVRFPPDIEQEVVSDKNPSGRLTNSDLELAAVLYQNMILRQVAPMQHQRAGIFSDNTPTVAWTKHMADKSQSPTAGRLLRGLTAMQRSSQSGPFTVASVAGKHNKMADIASRSFHLDDAAFLTLFHSRFPLPQNKSWARVHLMQKMSSKVTCTLAGKRLPLQQWMTGCGPPTGSTGSSSARARAGTRISSQIARKSNKTSSLLSLNGSGEVTTGAELESKLKPQKPPCVTWRKPSSWLDIPTPEGPTDPKNSTSHSAAYSTTTK